MDPRDQEAHLAALQRFGGIRPPGNGVVRGMASKQPPHFVEQILRGKKNCDARGMRRSAKQRD